MDQETVRRRQLPHWDVPNAAYFVTTCLEGSIPAGGLLELARYREELRQRPRPQARTDVEWRARRWKKQFVRTERWLDETPANRALAEPALAQVVVDAMLYFAGQRYDLYAYVVMPSHFHWLFRPLPAWVQTLADDCRTPRERITYSINRFTATACNRFMKRRGTFWQAESYDHWVRDADEMERIIGYIEDNPVKAHLVAAADQWPFSSASARMVAAVPWGVPLLPAKSGLES